ncbi:MAG: arabinogalactan endo-1,4-beta-galactosidase [Clostridium sp.]|nr:arabinogalactan endo-1,4-beta-galactosidase [Clostridium sp.]
MTKTFMKGMDISSYPEMTDMGYHYYDYDGKEVNLIDFAVSQGFNYGRLRIWNEPLNVPEAKGYCDLEHTKRMAQEIKKRGLGLLLDFHYSDWYADPGTQTKPRAWQGLNNDKLTAAVYDFTKNTLQELDKAGAYPDMVQIGNEIRCGMIWPEGKTDNWPMLARLINAGIKAVRDTQKQRNTKVMLHLDQGGRYYYLEEWFDNCLLHGVTDFDIIGLSYYAFWHGGYHDVKNSMEKLVERYDKPIILVEAAHGYRVIEGGLYDKPQEELSGFPSSPEGQKKVMELIMCITANISGNKGLGVFYWEPFCIPAGMDDKWALSMSLVDQNGRAMEGLKAFSENPYELNAADYTKLYAPEKIKLTADMADSLPERLPKEIKALRMDGNIDKLPVIWNDTAQIKPDMINEITGICNGQTITVRVEIVNDANHINLLTNGDFTDGLDDWQIEKPDCVDIQVREQVADELPYDSYHYLYVKGNDKFFFRMSRKIKVHKTGQYQFSLSFMGDNTTGVKVEMYIAADDRKINRALFPEELWHEHSVTMEITKTENTDAAMELEVGLIMDSPISYGAVKDVKLIINE